MKGLVVEAVKYDQDGIEIQFLNSREKSEHTKVRPCYRELSRLWPDFGGRRRQTLASCSRLSDRLGQLHSVPVWVTSARNISRASRRHRTAESVALSSPSQMAHRVSRSVSPETLKWSLVQRVAASLTLSNLRYRRGGPEGDQDRG